MKIVATCFSHCWFSKCLSEYLVPSSYTIIFVVWNGRIYTSYVYQLSDGKSLAGFNYTLKMVFCCGKDLAKRLKFY